MVRIRADPYVEFRRGEYGRTLVEILLGTEAQFVINTLSRNVYVRDLESSLGTEEEIVGSGSLVIGIVAVGIGVVPDTDSGGCVLHVFDSASSLVLPAVALVCVRPACSGSVGLGGSFLVEVVSVDDHVFRISPLSFLLDGNCPVVIIKRNFDLRCTVERIVA